MKIAPLREGGRKKLEQVWPPPIPFQKPKKSKKKDDEDKDDEKDKYRTFELYLDPEDDKTDTYKRKIKVFLEGTPEEWVEHQIEVTDLFNAGGYTTADQKISIYRAVYDGKAKDLFRYYHNA